MNNAQDQKMEEDEIEELDADEVKAALDKLSVDDEEEVELIDPPDADEEEEVVEVDGACADTLTHFYRQLKSVKFRILPAEELLANARSLFHYKAKVENYIYRLFCEPYHVFGPQHNQNNCWVCLTRIKIFDKCGARPSGKSLRLWANEQSRSINLSALFRIFNLRHAEKNFESIFLSNQRLVYSIARRSKWNLWKKISIIDLVQSGNVGLMHAIAGYDPNLGFKFSTYATWWIRQNIGRDAINTGSIIRLPVHIEDLFAKIYQIARKNQLDVDSDREKLVEVVAKYLADTPKQVASWTLKVEKILSLPKSIRKPYSLDLPHAETGDSLHEIVSNPLEPRIDEAFEKVNDNGRVIFLIKKRLLGVGGPKGKREWFVLMYRFGLEGVTAKPLWQIAKMLEISRERVRQIEFGALLKIKKFVNLSNGD